MDYLAVQTLDGRDVFVNPRAIASISETDESGKRDRLFDGKVHCVVTLLNGKFVTVVESCDAIRKRLENKP